MGHGAIIPFSRKMADAASREFNRFGGVRGRPAKLRFGDCIGLRRLGGGAHAALVQGRRVRADGRHGTPGLDTAANDEAGRTKRAERPL